MCVSKVESSSSKFECPKEREIRSATEKYRDGRRCFPPITFPPIMDATLNLAHCHALTAQLNSGTPTEFNELVQSSVDASRAR